MICSQCGKYTTTLIGGLCWVCWTRLQPNYFITNNYYKCPKCKGEFNNPAFNSENGTYKCPFCGNKMEGLNGN
jgi:DNA-directed RNA polymerase subunit RPC12/RpoP